MLFGDGDQLVAGADWDRVFPIPCGLGTKSELLAALAGALSLPDYFGANWDALADCLTDLGWVPQRRLLVIHGDLPLRRTADRAAYLEVLGEAVQSWANAPDHSLAVGFPHAARATIDQVLRTQ